MRRRTPHDSLELPCGRSKDSGDVRVHGAAAAERFEEEINGLRGEVAALNGELTARANELVTLRVRNRTLFGQVESRERRLIEAIKQLEERDAELRQRHDDARTASLSRDELATRLLAVEKRAREQQRKFECERQQWIVDKNRVTR